MSSMSVAAPDDECQFALILGKPGGGKGTISGKLLKVRWGNPKFFIRQVLDGCCSHPRCFVFVSQDFPQFHHISTGDVLRAHVRDETTLGRQAKTFMKSASVSNLG